MNPTAPSSFLPYRRFGAGDGYPFAIKNYWVRVMLAVWRKLGCLFTCVPGAGTDIETTEAITITDDVALALRVKRQYARKTVVSNLGIVDAYIYEGGCLVCIVPAMGSRVLPRSGKLALAGQARAVGIAETQVIVTTFIRCACGEDYEQAADSIGAHLL